jgi:hypothetical protein
MLRLDVAQRGGQFNVALSASKNGDHDVRIFGAVDKTKFGGRGQRTTNQILRLDQRVCGVAETVGHWQVEEHGQRVLRSGRNLAAPGHEADDEAGEYATAMQIAHLRSAPRKL